MKDNIILNKTKIFSLAVIEIYKQLQGQKEYILSSQLLRSATSIGANTREAIAGQSKKDFYSKICIAFKEAYETAYWLDLIEESHIAETDVSNLQQQCEEITKILGKIKISTENSIDS